MGPNLPVGRLGESSVTCRVSFIQPFKVKVNNGARTSGEKKRKKRGKEKQWHKNTILVNSSSANFWQNS